MENKILFTITILIYFQSFGSSQQIGIGTSWTYKQVPEIIVDPNAIFRKTLSINKDTIIDNEQYFVIEEYCGCSVKKNLYLRWEGKRIYNYLLNEKRILYDFNLTSGDTLLVDFENTNNEILTTQVIVDSTGHIIINNQELNIQYVSINNYEYQHSDWEGIFIENIGSLNWCLTPQFNLCEKRSAPLFCFESQIGEIFEFNQGECISNSTTQYSTNHINVAPNPITNIATVKSYCPVKNMRIMDSWGREISKAKIENLNEFVITNKLQLKGLYFILFECKNESILKIVIFI